MFVAFHSSKQKVAPPFLVPLPIFDVPFLVDTESSNVAVGAVLAQKKNDRKFYPLKYASRTMKAVAKKYSACERDALAVIFALKKLRVYLLSTNTFKLNTDHQALQYAFNKKVIHGRLALWLNFLAEYEF